MFLSKKRDTSNKRTFVSLTQEEIQKCLLSEIEQCVCVCVCVCEWVCVCVCVCVCSKTQQRVKYMDKSQTNSSTEEKTQSSV